ncbi:MAG: phosphatidylglycerophosphatase A [Sinobacteraceae bacterium]|nr:phosphatidylglycerophosphatase A [Nevskiaceae bacterium]
MRLPNADRRSGYQPPRELVLTTPEHLIAFGFGAGLAPFAPGTAGTLVALPLWLALSALPWPLYVAVLALLFAFGCWVCGASARLLGVHDYPGIVFDEIVGFLLAALPLLPALGWVRHHRGLWLLAVFVLFRAFDVWKPWPIRWFDRRLGGGLGIMFDDALAAMATAGLLAAGAFVVRG